MSFPRPPASAIADPSSDSRDGSLGPDNDQALRVGRWLERDKSSLRDYADAKHCLGHAWLIRLRADLSSALEKDVNLRLVSSSDNRALTIRDHLLPLVRERGTLENQRGPVRLIVLEMGLWKLNHWTRGGLPRRQLVERCRSSAWR